MSKPKPESESTFNANADLDLNSDSYFEEEFKSKSSSVLRTELEHLMRRARLINRELTSRMINMPWEPAPFTPARAKRVPSMQRYPENLHSNFNSHFNSHFYDSAYFSPKSSSKPKPKLLSAEDKRRKALTGVPEVDELPIKYRRAFLVLLGIKN